MYIHSLNDALYYSNYLEQYKPDELSGFNAPVQVFSNVENGAGIVGAFWRTGPIKIDIPESLLLIDN